MFVLGLDVNEVLCASNGRVSCEKMIGPDGYGRGGRVGGWSGVCLVGGVNGSELTSKCMCMRQIIWWLCRRG